VYGIAQRYAFGAGILASMFTAVHVPFSARVRNLSQNPGTTRRADENKSDMKAWMKR
jgi:hypothetical protein